MSTFQANFDELATEFHRYRKSAAASSSPSAEGSKPVAPSVSRASVQVHVDAKESFGGKGRPRTTSGRGLALGSQVTASQQRDTSRLEKTGKQIRA